MGSTLCRINALRARGDLSMRVSVRWSPEDPHANESRSRRAAPLFRCHWNRTFRTPFRQLRFCALPFNTRGSRKDALVRLYQSLPLLSSHARPLVIIHWKWLRDNGKAKLWRLSPRMSAQFRLNPAVTREFTTLPPQLSDSSAQSHRFPKRLNRRQYDWQWENVGLWSRNTNHGATPSFSYEVHNTQRALGLAKWLFRHWSLYITSYRLTFHHMFSAIDTVKQTSAETLEFSQACMASLLGPLFHDWHWRVRRTT